VTERGFELFAKIGNDSSYTGAADQLDFGRVYGRCNRA
jgi:hypothetical protein